MKKLSYKIYLNFIMLFLVIIFCGSGIVYAQDAQTYYKNGYTYFIQGNYEMAEQSYKKAIELNPDFENAHYWLGKTYKQNGNYNKAITEWKEVLRINSKNHFAFQNLLNSFRSTSRIQSNQANDYLGEGLKMIGNPEEFLAIEDSPSVDSLLSAIPYFKKAINIRTNLLEADYWVGEVYQVLAKKSNSQFLPLAIESYKKVIDKEEIDNAVSFSHPSVYWRSYMQLGKIYDSLKWENREEKLWLKLEEARALPYQQVLNKKGYIDFGYPDRVEVNFKDGDKIENWSYIEKDITFVVINGEVQGEKEEEEAKGKELKQNEIETKLEESVPEEKDN
jgi:tetratricopeptide (TPR) repeat protein